MALAESLSSSDTVASRSMRASARREADDTVVWLNGEHDTSTVADLSGTIARAIALDDADLIIDLSGVDFMGVATVRVIVRARGFLRTQSRSLSVRAPSKCAHRLLDACGEAGLIDPSPAGVVPTTPSHSALATRLAVPASQRVDPTAAAPAPRPSQASATVSARRVDAARAS